MKRAGWYSGFLSPFSSSRHILGSRLQVKAVGGNTTPNGKRGI